MASPSNASHDPFELAWLAALLLAVVLAFWYFAGEVLTAWGLYLKQAQLWVIARVWPDGSVRTLQQAVDQALHDPAAVGFPALAYAFDAVGRYLRWPSIALLAGLGLWLTWLHPTRRFTRRFDLRALAETMAYNWPFALHALRRGQIDIPLDDERWGMALAEWPFVLRHRLWREADRRLDEPRTRGVLTEQLGGLWRGPQGLPLHARALAGIFAMRSASYTVTGDAEAGQLKARSYALLRQLARQAADNKRADYLPAPAHYQAVIDLTAAYLDDPEVAAAIEQHAYNHTVLMRLLSDARRNGILPPALFNWLKGVDRPLWYALSTLGRRAPFTEALGPFAHYGAERQLGQALRQPVLDNAITGLQDALARAVRPGHS